MREIERERKRRQVEVYVCVCVCVCVRKTNIPKALIRNFLNDV